MPKKIPLAEWARRHYDPPPTPWVLRRWARDGEISPAPERVGREWYVLESARRGAANDASEPERRLTLVERLQSAA
jgi:predicted site-specific integrase-resolvase